MSSIILNTFIYRGEIKSELMSIVIIMFYNCLSLTLYQENNAINFFLSHLPFLPFTDSQVENTLSKKKQRHFILTN